MTLDVDDIRLESVESGPENGVSRIRDDVTVVASGKGGVGTSTVAALLALGFAGQGRSTLVVDAASTPGSLPLLLDAPEASGFLATRGTGRDPSDLAEAVTPNLSLIAFDGLDRGLRRVSRGRRTAGFRRLSSAYDEFDATVIDAGARLDAVWSACSAGAGRLLAVTGPERIAVAANYGLLKTMETRFPRLPLEVLVNRRSGNAARGVFSPLRSAVDYFLHRSVGFAGAVPRDQELRERVDGGASLQDLTENSAAAHAARRIATRILTEMDGSAGSASPVPSPPGRS